MTLTNVFADKILRQELGSNSAVQFGPNANGQDHCQNRIRRSPISSCMEPGQRAAWSLGFHVMRGACARVEVGVLAVRDQRVDDRGLASSYQ